MTTTALRPLSASESSSTAQHPTVRARKLTAGILTGITAVFSVGFVAAFGAFGAFVLAVTLPLPIMFLWASAEVLRADEVKS